MRASTAALWAAGLITAGLAGCGGGGGSSDTTATPSTVTVTTRVVDGPLQNAVVCLDANANDSCDAGEVQATTDADGNATLHIPQADAGKYALLAVVGAGAIDQDNGAVTTPYVLKAPADQTAVITPLTTLVQAHIEATGASTAAASDFVRSQAGLSVSPLADFSTSTGAGASLAATVARLVVLTTQQQTAAVQSNVVGQTDLSGATVTLGDLQRSIQQAVLAALPAVSAAATDPAVAGATEKNAALATVAQNLVANQLGMDAASALAAIGVEKLSTDTSAPAPTAGASLRALSFTDADNWYYRALEATAADNTADANGLVHYYDVHSANTAGTVATWGFHTQQSRQNDTHWNGSAWVTCPYGFRNAQSPRDEQGRSAYNYCDNREIGTSVRSSVNISGQTLASVIADKIRTFPGRDSGVSYASWGPADMGLLGSAVFPSGSMLQYQSTLPLQTALTYDSQSSAVVQAYTAAVAVGGDARTGTPACGAVTSANASSYRVQPATLEELVALSPGTPCIYNSTTLNGGASLTPNEWWSNSTASLGSVTGALTQPVGTGSYYTTDALLRVAFGANDAASYYACYERASDGSTRNCTLIGTGSYAIQTLGDARVMTFTGLPELSRRMGWSRVFVERGGKIYFGYQNNAGALVQTLRLNLPAANAVFAQLGMPSIVPN